MSTPRSSNKLLAGTAFVSWFGPRDASLSLNKPWCALGECKWYYTVSFYATLHSRQWCGIHDSSGIIVCTVITICQYARDNVIVNILIAIIS